jgi:NADH-quinone oxidoreductase subunit C
MRPEEVKSSIKEKFGFEVEEDRVTANLEKLRELMAYLKEIGYDYFSFMTAVDYKEHFELVYEVRNIEEKHELRVKVKVEKDEEATSVTDIYRGAEWMEREVFDLFGIKFKGHPDMRRILLPDEYEGHPLRKDFPMDQVFPPYRSGGE